MELPRRPKYWYLAAIALGVIAYIVLVVGRDTPADELAQQHIRERANQFNSEIASYLADVEPALSGMSVDAIRDLLDGATTWELTELRRLDDDNYEFTATANVELGDSGISATLPFIFNVSESAQRVISKPAFDDAEVSSDSSR